MDARRELLGHIRSRLSELSDSLSLERAELGRLVLASRVEEVKAVASAESLAEAVAHIQSLNELIPQQQAIADRIVELADRDSDTEQQISAAKEETRALEREGEGMVEGVGQAAYAAYVRAPQEFSRYDSLFAEAQRFATELHEIDSELGNQARAAEDRAFIRKVRESGRRVFLTSRRIVKANAFSRAIRGVGKSPETAELIAAGLDPQLSEIGAAYQNTLARVEKLSRSIEKLTGDLEETNKEIASLGASRRPQRRAEEVLKSVADLERDLEQELAVVGSAYTQARSEAGGKRISDRCAGVDELERAIQEHAAHAARLEAALELDALDRRIGEGTSAVATLEREIGKRQKSMEDTRTRIAELEQEKRKQEEIRGSVDTLLDFEVG